MVGKYIRVKNTKSKSLKYSEIEYIDSDSGGENVPIMQQFSCISIAA